MSTEDLGAQVEMAKQRLEEAMAAASAAEKRTAAEIRALEADLENERLRAVEAVRAGKARRAESEDHAETAEKRIEEAERRAAEAEGAITDAAARAREQAAAWLRGQVEASRPEAGPGLAAGSGEGDAGERSVGWREVLAALAAAVLAGRWAALGAAEQGASVC